MDCTRFEMLLVERVTGDLPEVARTELEAHLETCEACRTLRASLAQGAKYAASLPVLEAPKLDMGTLRAAMREVKDLVEGGMTQEEFELTRSFLSKYSLHFAETTTARLACGRPLTTGSTAMPAAR